MAGAPRWRRPPGHFTQLALYHVHMSSQPQIWSFLVFSLHANKLPMTCGTKWIINKNSIISCWFTLYMGEMLMVKWGVNDHQQSTSATWRATTRGVTWTTWTSRGHESTSPPWTGHGDGHGSWLKVSRTVLRCVCSHANGTGWVWAEQWVHLGARRWWGAAGGGGARGGMA